MLTRKSDWFSTLYRLVARATYSHASIGPNGLEREFYSFVKEGFRIENPLRTKRRRHTLCALYRLEASADICTLLDIRLGVFIQNQSLYHYNFFGLVLCLLRIPFRTFTRYFCSQFVSELLIVTGAVRLNKQSLLYLPDDFTRETHLVKCYEGTLGELIDSMAGGARGPDLLLKERM